MLNSFTCCPLLPGFVDDALHCIALRMDGSRRTHRKDRCRGRRAQEKLHGWRRLLVPFPFPLPDPFFWNVI